MKKVSEEILKETNIKEQNLVSENDAEEFKKQKDESNIKEIKQEDEENLGTEKIGKLVKKFSIPCIISLLVSALYNIVDQIFIGQGVGFLGNAATNIVYPMTVIAVAFALVVGDGAAAYLSLCLGRNDRKEAKKGVANAFVLTLILSVIFLAIGLIFRSQLLSLFGASEDANKEMIEYANQYMFWIVLGLPFFIVTTAFNSIIRADGSPKYAMAAMLVGAILNLILDPIAIFVFHAGVTGAAIATVIGQIASAIVSILYLRKFKTMKLEKQDFALKLKTISHVLSLGVSSFITQIAVTIVIIVMNNVLSKYGGQSKYGSEIPLSALGIVMKVNSILINISVGLAAGSQPVIGFNYGAKNYERVRKTLFLIMKVSVAINFVFFLIFQLCPQVIINIFGQENELYNEFAEKCFRIFLMLCIFNGLQIISGIFFQAIGKPIKAAIISLSRQILIFIPTVLTLSYLFGIEGVLYAGPIVDGLAFTLAMILLIIEVRKLIKMQKEVAI